jgi:hypothetical protein
MDTESCCNIGVIKSDTLVECSNTPFTPNGLCGPFVGKIPVVIAEPVVQIVTEACIELPEPVFEIKRIKKNLFINQCKLIDLGNCRTGKLFLGGFIRKNIEYATVKDVCEKYQSISGDIRHTTVNVYFNCVTEVHYDTPPQIYYQDNAKEMSLFIGCEEDKNNCSKINIGRYPCEQNFEHSELFNERVFCELEEVKIFEDDIHDGSKPISCDFPTERTFDKLTEKMVILVRIKLLQKQQVNIPGKVQDSDGKGKYIK